MCQQEQILGTERVHEYPSLSTNSDSSVKASRKAHIHRLLPDSSSSLVSEVILNLAQGLNNPKSTLL